MLAMVQPEFEVAASRSARAAWCPNRTTGARRLLRVGDTPCAARRVGPRLRLVRASRPCREPRDVRVDSRPGREARWRTCRPPREGRSHEPPAPQPDRLQPCAPGAAGDALRRVIQMARDAGVEVNVPRAEVDKHGIEARRGTASAPSSRRPRPRRGARRRRHDPEHPEALCGRRVTDLRRQLRDHRIPGHGRAVGAPGGTRKALAGELDVLELPGLIASTAAATSLP